MRWKIQNANDDYTRYQIEEEGFAITARVENIGNDPIRDALLHAAAPDLLAALVRLVACPDVNLDTLSPETIVAADQARDAIRKARGQ
jgi:hypothetical protein